MHLHGIEPLGPAGRSIKAVCKRQGMSNLLTAIAFAFAILLLRFNHLHVAFTISSDLPPNQIAKCMSPLRLHVVTSNRRLPLVWKILLCYPGRQQRIMKMMPQFFFPAAGAAESPWRGGALGGARGGFCFFFQSEHFKPF